MGTSTGPAGDRGELVQFQLAGMILHRERAVLFAKAGGGVAWANEPVLVVDPTAGAVAGALLETLAGFRAGAPMQRSRDGWIVQPLIAEARHWNFDGEESSLPPETSAEAVAERVAGSRVGAPMPDLRDHKDPVRKFLRARSERQLLREAAQARVERRDESCSIQPLRPVDERHWTFDGDPIRLPPETSPEAVAERILAELRARLPMLADG